MCLQARYVGLRYAYDHSVSAADMPAQPIEKSPACELSGTGGDI
jgi:hypothetical protein